MYRLTLIACLLALSFASFAQAYSYAEKEDPMTVLFKEAISSARNGKWGAVSKKADEGIALQKGHMFEADFLKPAFDEAIAAKDVGRAAELLANLVYLSIREKLHRNLKENFADFKKARARLAMARKSYTDALDANVKKQDHKRSEAILKEFDAALRALGNPGLFGVGASPPDATAYKKAAEAIEGEIVKSFPSFARRP